MSWIFKEKSAAPDPRTARRRATLLSVPFALMGLVALVLLLHDGMRGGLSREKAIQLVSVIVVAAGFPALIFGITAKKNSLLAAAARPSDPGNPWLKRPDWAAGRIKSAGMADAKSFLIMGIAFCVIGGLIAGLIIPKELRNGNYNALFALIFPLAGVGFLAAVVRNLLVHRRFGDCFFEMAAVPGALGGTLEGGIQTGVRLKLEDGLRLKLSCLRRVVSNQGNKLKVLWQDEKIFKTEAELPEAGSGHSRIPVCFKLPENQPESSDHHKEAIIWRLEADAKTAWPDFRVTFDVPVFKVAVAKPKSSDSVPPSA